MDDKQTEEKRCKNCKYFVMYYNNHKGLYKPLPFGHCICGKVLTHKKEHIFCNHVCERWESNQTKIQDCYKCIENKIIQMSEDLHQYMQFINEKNGN